MLVTKEVLLDKHKDILSADFIDFLIKIRYSFGYKLGHIKPIRKLIVCFEDLLNNKGREGILFFKQCARTLHWATGNSTYYLDYVNGSDANDGSDWANAWKTITTGATAARITAGDVIRIAKSSDPTSIGTATWTDGSLSVVLDSAVTANVDMCESAWTGTTYCTATTSSTRKEGSYSCSLALGSSHTTGKMAYFALAGSTDFSAYQQLSFWFRASNITISNANQFSINLCSDTTGDVVVDTFAIPAQAVNDRWVQITVNKGSALGSAIQSISVSNAVDNLAVTILIDDIIACKAVGSADSLSLTSLISKNSAAQGGNEGWYAVKSINGATISLDQRTADGAGVGRGYRGATENVTTYKRETIKTAQASGTTTAVQATTEAGTYDGGNISYQGGYDTSTSAQNGETFFDGQNGYGYGLSNGRNYITLGKLNFVRYGSGIRMDYAMFCDMQFQSMNNNTSYGLYPYGCASNVFVVNNINNNGIGMYFNFGIRNKLTFVNSNGNTSESLNFYAAPYNTIFGTNSKGNGNYSYNLQDGSEENRINNVVSSGNGSATFYIYTCTAFCRNCTFSDGTVATGFSDFASNLGGRIYSTKEGGDANVNKIYYENGTVESQTTTRHTASGIAWQVSPTDTDATAVAPIELKIAEVACSASNEVTAKVWVRRDDTGLTMKLICKGGQISGVASDVTDTISVAADTWEELSISFTPTEAGVIELFVQAYGGTSYNGYVDDITVSQV